MLLTFCLFINIAWTLFGGSADWEIQATNLHESAPQAPLKSATNRLVAVGLASNSADSTPPANGIVLSEIIQDSPSEFWEKCSSLGPSELNQIRQRLSADGRETQDSDQLIADLIKVNRDDLVDSDRFVKQVKDGLKTLPHWLIYLLKRNNCEVHLVSKVTDAFPKSTNDQRIDGQKSSSHDYVTGVFSTSLKWIVIGEYYSQSNELKPNSSCAHSVQHEVGHALDYLLGRPSLSPAFMECYAKDRANIASGNHIKLEHYLQGGAPGLKETFAELVASIYGDPSDTRPLHLPLFFPATYEFLHRLLPRPEGDNSEWGRKMEAAVQAYSQGAYAVAVQRYEDALKAAEKENSNELMVALTAKELARLYLERSDYRRAKPLYTRALKIYEGLYADNDPQIAECLLGIATALSDNGQYKEAESLGNRSLAIYEKAVGPNSSSLANSLILLAYLHYAQNKCATAEALYRRALEVDQKAFGCESPTQVTCLLGLANVSLGQGKYKESETYGKNALAIVEKKSPTLDQWLPILLISLADVCYDEGNISEAESLYKRSLSILEKQDLAGAYMATCLLDLGAIEYKRGNYQAAELMCKRSLAICEKTIGGDQPLVAAVDRVLARIYRTAGQYSDSERFCRRALNIDQKAPGFSDARLAPDLIEMGKLLLEERKYSSAESLFRRALHVEETGDCQSANYLANDEIDLAICYYKEGNFSESELLTRRGLEKLESVFGPEHPDLAIGLENLGNLLRDQGKFSEAEPLYRRAVNILEKAYGPDNWASAASLHNYAVLLRAMNRTSEAIEQEARFENVQASKQQSTSKLPSN